jgi:GxxExxY protein
VAFVAIVASLREKQNMEKRENELAKIVLDVCFRIHRLYGPGLFESVYEEIFCYEFEKEGIMFERQKAIPLIHEQIKLEAGFRADVIIENKLLVEFKSIEQLAEVHYKQVQTYLKLTNIKLGLLINFNTVYLKDGIHRIANGL